MKKGVSIVICCYNSVGVIAKTLEHISRQKVPEHIRWEVVLVDNGSTDGTAKKAERMWNSTLCETPFRLTTESKPGILNARIKGVKAARFEYIIFCDDDNWLSPDYVETVYKIMDLNSNIGILGGKGEPVFEKQQPPWFNKYKGLYACGAQSNRSGEITKTQKFVYGAGSVYRRSVLSNLISYTKQLDINQNKARCGDDVLFGLIHVMAGYKIFYDERLVFRHYINKERTNFSYLLKLKWYNGRADVYLRPLKDHIDKKITERYKFTSIKTKFMHVLSALKSNFIKPFQKKVLIHTMLSITRNVGFIINLVSFKKNYKEYTDEVNKLAYRIKREC